MLKGIAVSGGFAIGKIRFLEEENITYPSIFRGEEAEKARLCEALKAFTEKAESAASSIRRIVGSREADIFKGHIFIAHDPDFQRAVKRKIARGFNAETAMESACDYYIEQFSASDYALTKQRAADIRDVKENMLRILCGIHRQEAMLPPDCVLAAKEIKPSAVSLFGRKQTVAVLSETGNRQAHGAILLRAMGIPAVFGIQNLRRCLAAEQKVIVDGFHGEVIGI